MNPIYFPVLKAKDAEFEALRRSPDVNGSMIPLFEVPKFNPTLKKYVDDTSPMISFLSEVSRKISEIRSGQFAMFDTYHWQIPGQTVETGQHHLYYIYNYLMRSGVNAVPVVGYDRWEDGDYRSALRSISKVHQGKFCIRLDRFAFDDSADPEHFQARLAEMIEYLALDPAKCHVLLDLEDLSVFPIVEVIKNFDVLFSQITGHGFSSYSLAGCSLPSSIDQVIKDKDSSAPVKRREMLLWKYARGQYPAFRIYFGDYGVRGPSTGETGYGNTNAKIRYTVEDEYFILRGHVIRKPLGGYQHCELAQRLIDSGYYLYPSFSWGDAEIQRCANGEIGGGSTTWIKIDTSHHITFVVAEIAEFERSLAAQRLIGA